ncbi:CbrC family protein [Streptomyces sp. NPDC050418]|uniref:CbrC family protein n=1 Tax=Streptomyces sp. NPDC050418 TaxID=3365612 RepID=UPI0037AD58D2
MSRPLPSFRYHPDPVTTGAIAASGAVCVCCGQERGWIYTLPLYTEQEVPGRVCPWCIADGTAAERFDGEFVDADGLDGVSLEVLQEVTRRTPAFSAWQDPRWLVHCHDAAAFLGEVGYSELAEHPETLDQLRTDLRLGGWHDADQLEEFVQNLGGGASAMLFRCTICGDHLAYTDFS